MASLFPAFRNETFKQQLNIAVMAGVICFALLSSLLISWQGSHQIRQTLLAQGEAIAENLASQSGLALLYGSADNANEAVMTTLSFPDVKRVEIRYHSGKALIVRGMEGIAAKDVSPPDTNTREAYLEDETDDAWRFVASVLTKGGASPFEVAERKEEVLGFVRVVQSKKTLSYMQARIFIANLAISLLFASIFLLVIRRLANRMTQPITELSGVMARAELGELHVRAKADGPKDIRDMAQAFNNMIAALQERARALRESQANYRDVVDSVKEIIFQTDANGKWALLNPAWKEITGIEVAAALGHPMLDLVHDEDQPLAKDWQDRLKKGEVPACRFEVRFTRGDGSIGWLELAQRGRWDEQGKFAGTAGTLFDITERLLAAEKLANLNAELENRVRVRTAQLEASNRELEAFSYSVSHDLRTPLRAIDGFSSILLDDYSGKLDEEGKRLLNVVRGNTVRMGQLIDDILKFSRAGRAEIAFSEIDMDALAREVYEELRHAAGHELQVEVGYIPPAQGDRAMMRQVFVNLLSNAIKFSRAKKVPLIKVGGYIKENEAVYFVQDNGAGFDMRYADKLFGVFQRLHAESEFEGTGIGLAIVKRIVTRHGGRVWAEGKVNEGATICFALPSIESKT